MIHSSADGETADNTTQPGSRSVIDCHVHVSLRGDSVGIGLLPADPTSKRPFWAFLVYMRLDNQLVTDAVPSEATLPHLWACKFDGSVCVEGDLLYGSFSALSEDRTKTGVDHAPGPGRQTGPLNTALPYQLPQSPRRLLEPVARSDTEAFRRGPPPLFVADVPTEVYLRAMR